MYIDLSGILWVSLINKLILIEHIFQKSNIRVNVLWQIKRAYYLLSKIIQMLLFDMIYHGQLNIPPMSLSLASTSTNRITSTINLVLPQTHRWSSLLLLLAGCCLKSLAFSKKCAVCLVFHFDSVRVLWEPFEMVSNPCPLIAPRNFHCLEWPQGISRNILLIYQGCNEKLTSKTVV